MLGPRSEVLAWNRLGHALIAGHYDVAAPGRPEQRPNLTRMLFLDPHTRELYRRWDEEAGRAVASLRLVAGRHRDDRQLIALVGELTLNSREFAALWAGTRSTTACPASSTCATPRSASSTWSSRSCTCPTTAGSGS